MDRRYKRWHLRDRSPLLRLLLLLLRTGTDSRSLSISSTMPFTRKLSRLIAFDISYVHNAPTNNADGWLRLLHRGPLRWGWHGVCTRGQHSRSRISRTNCSLLRRWLQGTNQPGREGGNSDTLLWWFLPHEFNGCRRNIGWSYSGGYHPFFRLYGCRGRRVHCRGELYQISVEPKIIQYYFLKFSAWLYKRCCNCCLLLCTVRIRQRLRGQSWPVQDWPLCFRGSWWLWYLHHLHLRQAGQGLPRYSWVQLILNWILKSVQNLKSNQLGVTDGVVFPAAVFFLMHRGGLQCRHPSNDGCGPLRDPCRSFRGRLRLWLLRSIWGRGSWWRALELISQLSSVLILWESFSRWVV